MSSARSYYLRLTGNECGHLRVTSQRRACAQRLQRQHNRSFASSKVVMSDASSKVVRSDASSLRNDDDGQAANSTACTPSGCSLALCLFGLLPRYGRGPAFDAWLTEAIAQPSVRRHVLSANRQCTHDVFVHTWEDEPYKTATVQRAYAPRRAEFGKRKVE